MAKAELKVEKKANAIAMNPNLTEDKKRSLLAKEAGKAIEKASEKSLIKAEVAAKQ